MDKYFSKQNISNSGPFRQLISWNCFILKRYSLSLLFILAFVILGYSNTASAFFCGPDTIVVRIGETVPYNMEGDGFSVGDFQVDLEIVSLSLVSIEPLTITDAKEAQFNITGLKDGMTPATINWQFTNIEGEGSCFFDITVMMGDETPTPAPTSTPIETPTETPTFSTINLDFVDEFIDRPESLLLDTNLDGFSSLKHENLDGSADLGSIGDILKANGIEGSFAENSFNHAVSSGLIDPDAESLLFLTDSENSAKLKVTVAHPPIVIPPVALRIKTEKIAVFNSPEVKGKLRNWKRNINKILNDPDLSPEDKKRELDVIKEKKSAKYDKLVDDTGFEIIEEEVIIMLPELTIPQDWMIEFEFNTTAFTGMGEAIIRLVVEDFFPDDFPSDKNIVDSLLNLFPDADIYDFGSDNGNLESPSSTINFTFVDELVDQPAGASFFDVFFDINPETLDGNANVGKVGDILNATGIKGSFAETAFNDAASIGRIDPDAEALIFLTDSKNGAKLKITIPHAPLEIQPEALRIKTEKVAVFKTLEVKGKLRNWKRNINKILNDPDLSPDDKKRELDAIREKKPASYDKLIDETGFEIIEEEIVIMLPPITIPQEWMIEFEFDTSGFTGMGEAITRLEVEDLFASDFSGGVINTDTITDKFGDVDIFDFGTDNGNPEFPPSINFTFTDTLDDGREGLVFDSFFDVFTEINPQSLNGDTRIGKVGDILGASGIDGSSAVPGFDHAVSSGIIDPEAEALIFLTDGENGAKLKITVPHPPVVIPPGALRIKFVKAVVFNPSAVPSGKLRAWKRRVRRIVDNPDLSPEEQLRELEAVVERKPPIYRELFMTMMDEIIINLPGGVIPQDWMIEFEFNTPAFIGMGEAITRLIIEDLFPADFPGGVINTDTIQELFPDADIYNFGEDNGVPGPGPEPTELCGNGIDDDGDGLIDSPNCPEICEDGIDNDGDGDVDIDDKDCRSRFSFNCNKSAVKGRVFDIEKLILKLGEDETCKLKLTSLEPNTQVEIMTNGREFLKSAVELNPTRGVTDENGELEFTLKGVNKGTDWIAWTVPNEEGKFEFSKNAYDNGLAWGMFVEVD